MVSPYRRRHPFVSVTVKLVAFVIVAGAVRSFFVLDDVSLSKRYNLLSDPVDGLDVNCTAFGDLNVHRLQQNHPCLVQYIRKHFLDPPAPVGVAYVASADRMSPQSDPSDGQTSYVLELLNNQTDGFFVECGAMDGEIMSNTLYMERSLNWTGILIEANPYDYAKLLKRRRRSWTLPVCLSLEPYATRVAFQVGVKSAWGLDYDFMGHIDAPGTLMMDLVSNPDGGGQLKTIQCFPLYSILLAVGRTSIDYLSLDVEGHELAVLRTIPWHKVDIKVMTVEWEHIADGQDALVGYMESNGYLSDDDRFNGSNVHGGKYKDWFFARDSVALRSERPSRFIRRTLNGPIG